MSFCMTSTQTTKHSPTNSWSNQVEPPAALHQRLRSVRSDWLYQNMKSDPQEPQYGGIHLAQKKHKLFPFQVAIYKLDKTRYLVMAQRWLPVTA